MSKRFLFPIIIIILLEAYSMAVNPNSAIPTGTERIVQAVLLPLVTCKKGCQLAVELTIKATHVDGVFPILLTALSSIVTCPLGCFTEMFFEAERQADITLRTYLRRPPADEMLNAENSVKIGIASLVGAGAIRAILRRVRI